MAEFAENPIPATSLWLDLQNPRFPEILVER